MTRGGSRPGAGQPPIAGTPQTERINLTLTEAERAEIEAAVPDGDPVGRWIVAAALMRARGREACGWQPCGNDLCEHCAAGNGEIPVATPGPAQTFAPTHDFVLLDGTVVPVAAELRGDWIACEADGTRWYTVLGDNYPEWSCSARKVSRVRRVIKYGHRFSVCSAPPSFRFECECGARGNWVRSDDRAADRGDRHHRDAVRAARARTAA